MFVQVSFELQLELELIYKQEGLLGHGDVFWHVVLVKLRQCFHKCG